MKPSRSRRLTWWLAALVAAGLALAIGGWVVQRPKEAAAVQVQLRPLVRTLQFSARASSLNRVDIGATVTGRVERVWVEEGARVAPGQPLVRLEQDELRAALLQAVAGEQQAAARLAGLRGTGRVTAGAGVAQADATLRNARAELARVEQLVSQEFLSASRLDDARRAVDVAVAQQTAARAQALALEDAGTDVVQARAALETARASSAAARARLAQTELRSPAIAQVLARHVEPGQIVQPGKALLSLALQGPVLLIAQVDERFLGQLQSGQAATVVADAYPGQRFSARIVSLAPAIDAQRGAVEVKFALEGAAPPFLREDLTVSVEVETGRREQALAVPLRALRAGAPVGADNAAMVLVAVDGRATSRNVRLGLRTLEVAEVTQGLSTDDIVLLDANVNAGDRVRVQLRPLDAVTGPAAALGDAGSALTNAMGR